jgi:hypothetical protein
LKFLTGRFLCNPSIDEWSEYSLPVGSYSFSFGVQVRQRAYQVMAIRMISFSKMFGHQSHTPKWLTVDET